MRKNKEQHLNEITNENVRIHPDTLNSYTESSSELWWRTLGEDPNSHILKKNKTL